MEGLTFFVLFFVLFFAVISEIFTTFARFLEIGF